ncbi:MAG: ribosome assembly factor SBDS [Candidatus Micrarchaeota archaeon]
MTGIENTIIARLEKEGNKFEVLVDPKLSFDFKSGVKKDFSGVLVFDEVFKDANKGERQTEENIKKYFHTLDATEIAKKILEDGELQLTTDQRRKILADKKARIIAFLAANCINPRDKTPHPAARIEKAMEEARISIDAFESVEQQVPEIVDKIREIIPISMENVRVAVKIPAQYAGSAYGVVKQFGMSREQYGSDGSLMCVCEFLAGMQGEFYDKLNKLTSGQVETKIL